MIEASGIIFLTKDRRVLLGMRGNVADHAGEWAFPGGKLEDGESAEQAARRECTEEFGSCPDGDLNLICINNVNGVEFTSFVMRIDEPFDIQLNEEHRGFAWYNIDELPQGIHPGARAALTFLNGTETDVAKLIANGQLSSPQKFENMWLVDIRITGTGTAYRKKQDEFTYRPPENYLNPDFLERCSGLQVIMEHPKAFILETEEFIGRTIGAITVAYIKGDEVWGIAKIYDRVAFGLIIDEQLSTSPAVYFRDNTNTTITLDDGSTLLIEGKPSLLDHVAICSAGVWDKGGAPSGVNLGEATMAEEMKKEAAAEERMADARKDSDDERWDRVFDALGSMSRRMDALEDVKDEKKEDAKADSDDEKKEDDKKADSDEKKEEEKKDDEKKADSEDGEKEEDKKENIAEKAEAKTERKEEAMRSDSAPYVDKEARARIAEIDRKLKKSSSIDTSKLAEAQAYADSFYQAHSAQAPRPMDGEDVMPYRIRLANGLRKYSDRWKKVDLNVLPRDAFEVAEEQVFADSLEAARHPTDIGEGELREIKTRDETGRTITSFVGEPRSWMGQFASARQRVVQFNK